MFSLSFLTSLCFFDANLRIIDKTADRRGHFFPLQATKSFAERKKPLIFAVLKARMAELVDALDSKSSARKGVRVRPPLRVLLIKGLAILLRGFFVFPFSLIPPGTNLLLTFQRAIPQNSDFPPPRAVSLAHSLPNRLKSLSCTTQNRRLPVQYLLNAFPVCINTKKPAAFSGRRLKSTIERLSITGNPDSQGSG